MVHLWGVIGLHVDTRARVIAGDRVDRGVDHFQVIAAHQRDPLADVVGDRHGLNGHVGGAVGGRPAHVDAVTAVAAGRGAGREVLDGNALNLYVGRVVYVDANMGTRRRASPVPV